MDRFFSFNLSPFHWLCWLLRVDSVSWGEQKQGRGRTKAAGDQSWTLDTYSGTTCLICGFTYPSTALAAEAGAGIRTKVSGSSGSRNPALWFVSSPHGHGASAGMRFPTDCCPINTC